MLTNRNFRIETKIEIHLYSTELNEIRLNFKLKPNLLVVVRGARGTSLVIVLRHPGMRPPLGPVRGYLLPRLRLGSAFQRCNGVLLCPAFEHLPARLKNVTRDRLIRLATVFIVRAGMLCCRSESMARSRSA
jgi:hypothetical protein